MSVALPVVTLVFGSVTPPQGDVLDLKVHLGCTNEVSSFSCLLQNFDKKYTETYPINVGVDGSISIGRGSDCPLIATIRVEEITCESTPVENYLRVQGRCWGEKLFRRVVTKTYEDKKGEEIVKDLVDYFVGLSHVRNSTELIENTDTTYTKLEYENTPVFDILKYIADSADKAGVIGYEFRVEHDAKFAFFPRNSKTSPISLSELIEVSEYRKDIHRVRNKITVFGAAEKKYPTNGDSWTETLDINGDQVDDWHSGTGTGSFWIDNLFFNQCRWEATQEDLTSQNSYGLRELVEVDEELHSDNECMLRAKALLAHLKDSAEYLTVRSNVIDYGTNRILPGDKIHVALPNENIDADFRIISAEYHVNAAEQTLEITLELGKEAPLLADYLYALRSKSSALARTKAGKQ